MSKQKKSTRVPKAIRPKYDAILAVIDPICDQYLDSDYKQYAHYLLAALARKRPSPIERGHARSWAAGVVHALGTVNFLFDASFEPHLKAAELYRLFKVSEATGQSKSKHIRDLFGMGHFDPEWTLPSMMADNPLIWLLEIDGMLIDARTLPVEMQDMLVDEGYLPFAPGDMHPDEAPASSARSDVPSNARCGLCGKKGKLTRTPCCGNWICDDADQYVMFSYAHNSCYRNHDRYTLCALHWHEGHDGPWQTCPTCREQVTETEMYVWYGTNAYNFTILENPPAFEPTHCASCARVINLAEEGYMLKPNGDHICTDCSPQVR